MTCEFIPSLANADICKTCGTSFFDHKPKRNPRNAGRKRQLTAAQEMHILQWFRSCRTVKEKAREMGIVPATLYNVLVRHDPSRRAK